MLEKLESQKLESQKPDNILTILNQLGSLKYSNVPDDKKDPNEIHYHILHFPDKANEFLVLQKPKTSINKTFLEKQNGVTSFSIKDLNLSANDEKLLQKLESSDYIFTRHTGVPFATGETRPFPVDPTKSEQPTEYAKTLVGQPPESDIISVYSEILK